MTCSSSLGEKERIPRIDSFSIDAIMLLLTLRYNDDDDDGTATY
jgi:hypothetical protein